MNLKAIGKFIEYFVEGVEWVKARYADYQMKKANQAGEAGDQREEEKLINTSEPGPTRFRYLGLFKRPRKKSD